MKKIKIIQLTILIFLLGLTKVNAQNANTASGGNILGNGGSVDNPD